MAIFRLLPLPFLGGRQPDVGKIWLASLLPGHNTTGTGAAVGIGGANGISGQVSVILAAVGRTGFGAFGIGSATVSGVGLMHGTGAANAIGTTTSNGANPFSLDFSADFGG